MSDELLSDVLTRVRLTGAVVFRVAVRGPWCMQAGVSPATVQSVLPPGTRHLIAFHIALKGRFLARCARSPWQTVEQNQVVVIPRGDRHVLGEHKEEAPPAFERTLGGRPLTELRNVEFETGDAPETSLLCGFLGCDRSAFAPLFASLPDAFVVTLSSQARLLLDYAVSVTLSDAPGCPGLRTRLAELLFMEALCAHVRQLPQGTSGWLGGLRHPVVHQALRHLHQAPAADWSVDKLAAMSCSSRSFLAREFKEVIGQPPMQYLAALRMNQAARHLRDSALSIDSIAEQVGYASSAAFQRAFKRCHGETPGRWRQNHALH